MSRRIIVIGGPTATGKTTLGLAVAKALGGEIVSADSMQIYRGLDIGTAKVTPQEMQGVPHHMLDVVPPDGTYSVAEYQMAANQCIEDILARGKVPIVVGGTGLYINSILYPMQFRKFDPAIRRQIALDYQTFGNQYMYEKLVKEAPDMAAKLSPNDVKRVTRCLELVAQGTTHSTADMDKEERYPHSLYVLSGDRAELYQRIEMRVDNMLREGLVKEVQELLAIPGMRDAQSFQAIAYKEFAMYLEGDISYADAIALIKQRSRNYAKRQLTWFRQYIDAVWLQYNDSNNATRIIQDYEQFK